MLKDGNLNENVNVFIFTKVHFENYNNLKNTIVQYINLKICEGFSPAKLAS